VAASVFTVGADGQLFVDGHSVVRPFLFQVIGDPNTLESAMLRPGGVFDLQRSSYPGLSVTAVQRAHQVLGVYRTRRDSDDVQVSDLGQQ
jgi:uncharacterized protein YlxW (UPF0749 family)